MKSIERNRILGHLLVWGIVWFLLYFFFSESWEYPNRLYARGFPLITGILLLIGINEFYLLPQFYFKKKIGTYTLICILLFMVIIWLLNHRFFIFPEMDLTEHLPKRNGNKPPPHRIMSHFVPLFISFAGSMFIELTHFANEKEKAAISLEKEKLDTEIKFLRSQINPHFLFNVLNNIYTLTVIKSDKAPDNLMRLSEMLRYMLYDTNAPTVPLKKEIDYMENYINLAALKDSQGLNINIDLDKTRPHLPIAPLLFISFLENAFKHSKIEDLENGFIHLTLKTTDNQIQFRIENSIPELAFKKDNVGGIGLENTKQRLALLYPNHHQLEVSNDGKVYMVDLKIDLI